MQDYDPTKGTILVRQAVVLGREKDRTKTNEDRLVELCPRAHAVLKRQLALREACLRAGRNLNHDFLFFKDDCQPFKDLKCAYSRWRYVLEKLPIRYREPYNARHTFVTMNLMVGKNIVWVADQHGTRPS